MVNEYDVLLNELCIQRKTLIDNEMLKEKCSKIKNIEILARNLVLEKIAKYQKESNDILVGVIYNDK